MKFFKKIYSIELKILRKFGSRFTYLLLFLSIIGCYYLGYIVGKIIF